MPFAPPNDPKPPRGLLAGTLLALFALAAPARAAPPSAPFSIVALGSSSTQGTGASSPALSYPAQLQRLFDEGYSGRLAVTVTNKGIAGEDIDDMAKRLDADVLSRHPDLVIWQAGSNDPLRGVPVDRFVTELKSGIEVIRTGGAEVVLMEPQWSPVIEKADSKESFVDAVREVGAQEHVAVVRRFALMRGWIDGGVISAHDLIGPDGLHMTDRGYGLLARAVLDQIVGDSPTFRARSTVATAGKP
ncbi:SGNH/GDSL hydrolase family protein [Lichenibacterium minor]|uniref:SGNH/GDSL hydrolase family protein n=1 Tax=Lichenibacterium minor TaxID=2316528 RepID=A0A4Q2TYM9_9HYPH|nr:GDSL-type esterase/lipase family protein [Lichenibacterium minor]RYC29222.1 SGNH/GDSL hydrolase family protein [Lichenibacterium minor]